MKNKYKIALLSILILQLLTDKAVAQSDVHLSLFKESSKKILIAMPDFLTTEAIGTGDSFASQGARILKNDLKLAGIFNTVSSQKANQLNSVDLSDDTIHFSDWNAIGAQAVVKGEYIQTENGIAFKLRLFDIKNRKYLIGKYYKGQPKHLRQIIHKFADEITYQLTNEMGIAQSKIAFVSANTSYKEVYLVDYDGYNLKQITNEQSLVMSPEWSPDSRKIVFTSYKRKKPYLKIINIKSRKSKTVVNFPGLNSTPAWSPDGKKIAFTSSKDGNPEIYLINSKGAAQRLTHFRGIDTSPTWSPDGKKIAFTSDRSGSPQIYMMDAEIGDTKMIKRLSFKSGYNDMPVWSPKEDKIAYSSLRNNRFEIVIIDLATGKEIAMAKSGYSKESPAWSKNGRFIAFSSVASGLSGIYIMKSDGTGIRRLTFLKGGGFSPAWSHIQN